MNGREAKKAYSAPELKDFGSVTQLTQTGLTNPGQDAKSGSRLSQGG